MVWGSKCYHVHKENFNQWCFLSTKPNLASRSMVIVLQNWLFVLRCWGVKWQILKNVELCYFNHKTLLRCKNEEPLWKCRVADIITKFKVSLTSCSAQRLDKALRDKHSGDKKRHEQLQSTLSQTITTTLSGKLDKSVKAEIKSAVVPSVQKVLSAVQEQLNTTLGQVCWK